MSAPEPLDKAAPRARVMDKIRKCLALASSSNPHEAAAAIRQAQKLMELHGITESQVQAAKASECLKPSGARRAPPDWEAKLASRVSSAFGCSLLFVQYLRGVSQWSIIGVGAAPEVASYAFTVLLRQAKRARQEHIKTALKRCGTASKTRRADIFCDGWVDAACSTLAAFAPTPQDADCIAALRAERYPDTRALKTKNRSNGRLTNRDVGDYLHGELSGRGAQLHHGVGANQSPLAIGGQL